jgi:hypothetical protein
VDTTTGASMWQAGPCSACLLPLTLTMLSNGDLVVFNKRGQVVWHSQSACSCDAGCYRAELQVSQLGMQLVLHCRPMCTAVPCPRGTLPPPGLTPPPPTPHPFGTPPAG